MPIVPDDKDWTWVIERACPECGFDASTMDRRDVPTLIRRMTADWCDLLAEAPDVLRSRTHDGRWSPLEYACHVRDVFRLYEHRLQLMLTLDAPTYPNWDQDQSAVDDRYNEHDPASVGRDVADRGEVLASAFEAVPADAWSRRGTRSDGARFTIETFARYLVHDPIHHLHDVRADLALLRQLA